MSNNQGCTCGFCGQSSIQQIAENMLRDSGSRAGAIWAAKRFAARNEQDGHQCAANEYRQVAERLERM